jgi:hypothetical protein
MAKSAARRTKSVSKSPAQLCQTAFKRGGYPAVLRVAANFALSDDRRVRLVPAETDASRPEHVLAFRSGPPPDAGTPERKVRTYRTAQMWTAGGMVREALFRFD